MTVSGNGASRFALLEKMRANLTWRTITDGLEPARACRRLILLNLVTNNPNTVKRLSKILPNQQLTA